MCVTAWCSHLIGDAFSLLLIIGVRVNDLIPERTQGHVGSLDKQQVNVNYLNINKVLAWKCV